VLPYDRGFDFWVGNLGFKARETHCTPKHASWFNAAEIEINVMNVECTGKRVNDIETLIHELAAWTKKE
jgi:hypothetical protein